MASKATGYEARVETYRTPFPTSSGYECPATLLLSPFLFFFFHLAAASTQSDASCIYPADIQC